jgi:hypothetical protein
MQGIDNPINAVGEVLALASQLGDLGAGLLELGAQPFDLGLGRSSGGRASRGSALRGPSGLAGCPLCHSVILIGMSAPPPGRTPLTDNRAHVRRVALNSQRLS